MSILEQTTTERPDTLLSRGEALVRRFAVPALRLSLGLVFVWFGALKITGDSPVAGLVHATLPWFDQSVLMPTLGWIEVALGLLLLAGRFPRLTLVAIAGHLTGTFLTFVDAPSWVISGGNPLLLTANGEFVLKNLVLICAALVLLTRTTRPPQTVGGR
jgi:putative oxidoreductase